MKERIREFIEQAESLPQYVIVGIAIFGFTIGGFFGLLTWITSRNIIGVLMVVGIFIISGAVLGIQAYFADKRFKDKRSSQNKMPHF